MTETIPTSRKLATVETVVSVHPIPDADAIERVRVRGWDVVVKKGDVSQDQKVLYIEVDSHLSLDDPRFAFLESRGVRTSEDGFRGHVLKTAKLRGQYSQGIVFPLWEFPELAHLAAGDDATPLLPIQKWDPPLPADLGGAVRGQLPSWIPTTDEDRIQNVADLLTAPGDWVATEKIDGTSMTAWVDGETDEGVSGRNWDWTDSDTSSFWRLARENQLHEKLRAAYPGQRAAVQGELFGPGLQKNPLGVPQLRFLAFNVVVNGTVIPRGQWPQSLLDISVPVYDFPFPGTVDEALEQVEQLKSLVTPGRGAEGVVWRLANATQVEVGGYIRRASAKALSRKYLLKNDR